MYHTWRAYHWRIGICNQLHHTADVLRYNEVDHCVWRELFAVTFDLAHIHGRSKEMNARATPTARAMREYLLCITLAYHKCKEGVCLESAGEVPLFDVMLALNKYCTL